MQAVEGSGLPWPSRGRLDSLFAPAIFWPTSCTNAAAPLANSRKEHLTVALRELVPSPCRRRHQPPPKLTSTILPRTPPPLLLRAPSCPCTCGEGALPGGQLKATRRLECHAAVRIDLSIAAAAVAAAGAAMASASTSSSSASSSTCRRRCSRCKVSAAAGQVVELYPQLRTREHLSLCPLQQLLGAVSFSHPSHRTQPQE